MAKNRTEIRVGGHDYALLSVEPSSHVLRVAQYVDEKLGEVGKSPQLSTNMVQVLTALNIANELFKTQDERDKAAAAATRQKKQISELQLENAALKERLRAEMAKNEAETDNK